MSRKLMVLGLAAVLAIAVAIPVVAEERVATPKLQKISKQALKKSATALRTAREGRLAAQRAEEVAAAAAANAASARQVATDASGAAAEAEKAAAEAEKAAAEAKSIAAGAQTALDANATQIGHAPGTVATISETFVPLPGGPSVTVTVPTSGLIEVWAQATLEGGSVSLYEDGVQMPGQSEVCAPEGAGGALFAGELLEGEASPTGTPAVPPLCGTLGAPGPVLFQTTPGEHTYELRYATTCTCEESPAPSISDRRLYVAPRP